MEHPLILSRYRPLETRGKGGFGVVDVAWDTRLQRRVAIKRIPLRVNGDDLSGIQEARTAALLNDAHIVSVLDFEVTGTEALLIMENIDGPTLSELLAQSSELLDLDTVASIIDGVVQALECAHENQVLHLDIKPANILIDHAGRIKVTDFGLAELSTAAGFSEPQGGTIGYMPPEQLQMLEVDQRTDLWALAALTYQLLTGDNPFFAPSTAASLELIEYGAITLPSAFRDDLDPQADAVLVKALTAEKTERYPSVSAFSAQLQPYLGTPAQGRKHLRASVAQAIADDGGSGGADGRGNASGGNAAGNAAGTAAPTAAGTAAYDTSSTRRPPLWSRFPPLAQSIFARLVAALACGTTAWVGLSCLTYPYLRGAQFGELLIEMAPQASLTLQVCLALAIALGAYLVPQLGSALALVTLVVGAFLIRSPFVGAILAVLVVIWWVTLGRRGAADSNIVTLVPVLGALWMPFAVPLLAGACLPWRRALGASLASGLLLMVLAPLTGVHSLYKTGFALQFATMPDWGTRGIYDSFAYSMWESFLTTVTQPATWVILAGWIFATFLMALLCRRGTRVSCFVGSLLATVVLVAAAAVVPYMFMDNSLFLGLTPFVETVLSLTLSFALMGVLTLLGVVPRTAEPEED